MYYVYLLKSKIRPEKTYIGLTNNFKRRFIEHNLGLFDDNGLLIYPNPAKGKTKIIRIDTAISKGYSTKIAGAENSCYVRGSNFASGADEFLFEYLLQPSYVFD